MQLDNALYAVAQIVHNFGATAVVGLPVAAICFKAKETTLRKIYWLTLCAWLAQAASGASFGMVSYFVVGELPEIHNLALAALYVKISCALFSIILLVAKLGQRLESVATGTLLRSLTGLGSAALFCAAILRWFS